MTTPYTTAQLDALPVETVWAMEPDEVSLQDLPYSTWHAAWVNHLLANPEAIFDLSEQAFGLDAFTIYANVRMNKVEVLGDPMRMSLDDLAELSDEDVVEIKGVVEISDFPRQDYEAAYEAWKAGQDPDVADAFEPAAETGDFDLWQTLRVNGATLPGTAPAFRP